MSNKFKVKNGLIVDSGTTTITGSLIASSSNATQLQIGSNLLFVSSSGNVGIGTITPSYPLDANGIINTNNYFRSKNWLAGGENGGQYIVYDANNTVYRLRITNTGITSIGPTDLGARLGVRGLGATSATTALRIENSNASASLTVRDDGLVTVMPNNANITIDGSTSSGGRIIIQSPSSNALIGINSYNTFLYPTKLVLFARSTIEGATNVLGDLRFYNITTGKTYMFMTETGLTSINKGTVTPNAELDVSGSVIISGSASNSLRVRGSGATSATNTLRIENINTTASFIVRDDGNIAINNTSPGSLLTLNTSFASTNGLTISSDGSSDAQIVLRRAVSKPVLGLMAFDTATYISNGIYFDGGVWVHHSDGNDNSVLVFDPGVGASWFASNNGAGSWNVASNVTLWDDAANWKSLVQSTAVGDSYFTGGKVGIGTASPDKTLHVDGTIRIDNQNSSAPSGPNASGGSVTNYWGTADGTFLSTPNTWLKINLGGSDYYLPAYS